MDAQPDVPIAMNPHERGVAQRDREARDKAFRRAYLARQSVDKAIAKAVKDLDLATEWMTSKQAILEIMDGHLEDGCCCRILMHEPYFVLDRTAVDEKRRKLLYLCSEYALSVLDNGCVIMSLTDVQDFMYDYRAACRIESEEYLSRRNALHLKLSMDKIQDEHNEMYYAPGMPGAIRVADAACKRARGMS
jgi:hypothetical protein